MNWQWAVLLIIGIMVVGMTMSFRQYQTAGQRNTPSTFMSDFSIGSIIEATEPQLTAEQISSGQESSPTEPFMQKKETAVLEIDQAATFGFMRSLKSEIERAITNDGFRIFGEGDDSDAAQQVTSFSCRYRDDKTTGQINVWGVRTEGTKLTLIAQLTEW